jgi:uncharacterized membrane protein YczE
MPLMVLAVTLAGLVASSLGPKTDIPASALQVVIACAAGLEICTWRQHAPAQSR